MLCPWRCRVRFRPPGNPTARASAFLYPSPYAVVTAGNASKSEQYLPIEKKSRTVSGSDIKDGLNFNVIGDRNNFYNGKFVYFKQLDFRS